MIKKNITIPRTARYFLSAAPSGAIKEIWFVCHGYGQLASYFLKSFDALNTGNILVVAPEGLHRFYWSGFSGKIVASWMTKEDREDDIHDYVNYLDSVYTEVMAQVDHNVKITVLGFSQGTATVCRWLAAGHSHADHLVLWAGAFPADMDLQLNRKLFEKVRTILVTGDKDEFIKEEQVREQVELLDKNGIRHELMRFTGKHEIKEDTLLELASRLKGL
jgi:predicted esterase